MKFSICCRSIVSAILFFSLPGLAVPAAPDNSLSIWAQDTIDAIKKWRGDLYARNGDLYQHQHYFDDPVNCLTPVPPTQYVQGTTCPRANALASYAANGVAAAWKGLSEAMFPLNYSLPDTSSEPRASLSDFSHRYNELNVEIQSLLNSTQYFICLYKIVSPSATHKSVRASYVNNDYGWVRSAPDSFHNGTEDTYPYYGRFRLSIIDNVANTQARLEDTLQFMEQPTSEFTETRCPEIVASGIAKPVFPDA